MPTASRALRAIWSTWRRIGHRIAVINGAIIMALFYALVLTPYALLARLLRRDLLDRRRDASASTYWSTRKPPSARSDSYARPF